MAKTSRSVDWEPVNARMRDLSDDDQRAAWETYFSEKDKYPGKYNHEVLAEAIAELSRNYRAAPSMAAAAQEYEEAIAGADLISCATKS